MIVKDRIRYRPLTKEEARTLWECGCRSLEVFGSDGNRFEWLSHPTDVEWFIYKVGTNANRKWRLVLGEEDE